MYTNNTPKTAPRFLDDTHVLVTKEFAKNSRIFGTPEYKLWKEIRQDCREAQMVTNQIKRNPNKKTNRNMTYSNMIIYIKQQPEAEKHLKELESQILCSKLESNPYRAVLAWFEQTFEGHDSYKQFFAQKAQEEAQKQNIFTVIKSSAIIEEDESSEFGLAASM